MRQLFEDGEELNATWNPKDIDHFALIDEDFVMNDRKKAKRRTENMKVATLLLFAHFQTSTLN